MLKFVNTQVTFAEIPDHITLCINLSNCPCHCSGCHSSYLAEDIGKVLTFSRIESLLDKNKGITAVCFMGGDNDPKLVNHYAKLIKESKVEHVIEVNCDYGKLLMTNYIDSPIKIGWYSGRQELAKEIDINNFDFIKIGPYLKECGPLNCRTTNQRFYEVIHTSTNDSELHDITYKFWKNETKD